MTDKARWYAAGGDIARSGPHASQRQAYAAMRLTSAARDAQRKATGKDVPYPHDVVVWPKYGERP